jgi:hypothetical protein
LVLPDDDELLDQVVVNGNMTTIDTLAGAIVCTSVTQPSTTYRGMVIYETDTRKLQVRNSANSAWVPVNGIPIAVTTDITAPYNGQFIYDLGNATLWRYQSSNTQWYRYPDVRTIYKPTTESVTSSTTFQDDNHFTFSVLANSAYALESYIPYDGAAAGDLKMQFTGPALASMFFTNFGANTAAPAEYNVVVETLAAAGSARGVAANDATVMSCQPKGTLVVGATAGTLQFQWAQFVSNATATRILGGAWMRLTKIA